ncbi:MAG: MATE family efflux transporter, partial [Defluviitaleaceae bacterium]|nr:MATE family efflux transporter [Defluviitaleaceae bacterium]
RGEITEDREAYRSMLAIAVPAVAEMVSIALIGMVDVVMVGRLGAYAVTAVGLTTQPRFIFLSVFFALNVAVTAIVSRRKGEGNREAARLCLRMAIFFEIALGTLLAAISVFVSRDIMLLAGAKADTVDAAAIYFKTMSYSLPMQILSVTICAAQRGVGNTRVTMKVNITANVIKLALNFLLIEGRFGFPRLEVQGAAISTVIGMTTGLILAVASLLPSDAYLRISFRDSWKLDRAMLKTIFRLTGGSMLEQVSFRVGFFTYARIVADLGTDSFAAHMIAMQLMNLSFTFADGFAAASTSLVGQNLGKRRPDLSIMYGKIGQRLAFCVAVVLCFASFYGRFFFASLFTSEPPIISLTAGIIVILAMILPMQTSQIVMAGSLRGAGDTRYVALTMLITVVFIRPGVSFLMIYVFGMGLSGAWYAIAADQAVRLLMLFTRFSRGRWINLSV